MLPLFAYCRISASIFSTDDSYIACAFIRQIQSWFYRDPSIHQDITQAALPFLKRDVPSVIKVGSMKVDDPVSGFYWTSSYHFDNCQFEETTISINDRYTRLMRIQTEGIWTDEHICVNLPCHN